MKKLIALALSLSCACAFAAPASLLERALECKLADKDLASMMRDLGAADAAMKKPASSNGAPTVDIYQLTAPVTALGYTSSTIAVMPGRILLAVPGTTVSAASTKLKLKPDEFSPSSREVRPTVSVVAFQLSAKPLDGKLLVGCEYANPATAKWIAADGFSL
jgi:hypothetical protein